MLDVWFTNIKMVNHLVVAPNEKIVRFCESKDVLVYKRDPGEGIDSVTKTGGNHAISRLKFRVLREFLEL